MNVPKDPACVDFSHGQDEAERQVKLLCTRLLAGWADLQISDMQVSRISGGISNLLVKVEPPPPLQPVAVKVFGDKTELLIDREAEKRLLLQLNAAGFGAPVIGLFGNGRIERFLTAKTLNPEEMSDPRFVPHIARRLRAFHDLRLDAAAAGAAGPPTAAAASGTAASASNTTAQFTSLADADRRQAVTSSAPQCVRLDCPGSVSEPPSQWDNMFSWLSMAERLSFAHDPAKQAAYDKVDFAAVRSELMVLRELCDRVGSPRVLCHNDLLSGNILVVQHRAQQHRAQQQGPFEQQSGSSVVLEDGMRSAAGVTTEDGVGTAAVGTARTTCLAADEDVLAGGELQFIDFEYSCYGPRGFDWGNHFNEYAGFDCVYDRFPTPEQQKAFFRHYLLPQELHQELIPQHQSLQIVGVQVTTEPHHQDDHLTANGAYGCDGGGNGSSSDPRRRRQQQQHDSFYQPSERPAQAAYVLPSGQDQGQGLGPNEEDGTNSRRASVVMAPSGRPGQEAKPGGGGGGGRGSDGAGGAAASATAGAAATAEEAVLDRLVAEACVFALASHAYWGVWSYIQARYSPIEFDYLDYSRMRWAEYYRRRDEFFGMVHRLFPSAASQ